MGRLANARQNDPNDSDGNDDCQFGRTRGREEIADDANSGANRVADDAYYIHSKKHGCVILGRKASPRYDPDPQPRRGRVRFGTSWVPQFRGQRYENVTSQIGWVRAGSWTAFLSHCVRVGYRALS